MRDLAKEAGQRLLHWAVNDLIQAGSGFRRHHRLAASPGEPLRKRVNAASDTQAQSKNKNQWIQKR